MAKYKYFSEEQAITGMGRWFVSRQNGFLLALIRRHHRAGASPSILEVGPGHGAFARACREAGFAYEAIEANPAMAERLRSDGFAVTVSVVPPLPDGQKKSVIVMQHVLEHMRGADEALALLSQCAGRLGEGGLLIVCGPDITVMKEDFFDCDYTHVFPTSVRRLGQMFHDAGLEVLESGLENALGANAALLRVAGFCGRLAYGLGVLHLLFRGKAYVAKTTLYGSCYTIGRMGPVDGR